MTKMYITKTSGDRYQVEIRDPFTHIRIACEAKQLGNRLLAPCSSFCLC
jgi:hypothetical protein